VRKVLEESVECQARAVDVDFPQLAVEIGVFVDEA
jgi:hypothetical protein